MDGGIVALIVSVVGVAGALGIAWPVFRSKTKDATVELLEQSLAITRREANESEQRCQRDIAELRGRVATLTVPFAREIAGAVVTVLKDELPNKGIRG